jgi:hypothetical protein
MSLAIVGSPAWSDRESRAERYIESAYHSLYRRLQRVSHLRSCFDMGWMHVNRHSVAHNFRSRIDVIDLVLLLSHAIREDHRD